MIVRVSTVEAFRQWREDEEAELEPMLGKLRGDEFDSDLMRAGRAFHSALEVAQEGEANVLTAPGYRFEIDCPITIALPPVRELRASKQYGPLIVTGQVDALDGLTVVDHKTTGRYEPEWYLPGYQWRLYLDIFGAFRFRWNIFEMTLDRIQDDAEVYRVFGFHVLEQTRYPELAADCARLVSDLHEFIVANDAETLRNMPQAKAA